jgi:hypothetical protein
MKKVDFTELFRRAAADESLAKDLVDLAARHGIELTDEISDEDLEKVAGGASAKKKKKVAKK